MEARRIGNSLAEPKRTKTEAIEPGRIMPKRVENNQKAAIGRFSFRQL